MTSLKSLYPWPKRRHVDDERRAEKERKRNAISGSSEAWRTYDFFLRAQQKNIPGIPDERCFTLQSVIRSLHQISGDVAECGVRFGKSAAFLIEADVGARRFHLFDSFDGLPEPSRQDFLEDSGLPYWKKGDIPAPETVARGHLADYANVDFYRGWIPDRFDEVADRRFAMVHVDVDLYEPTRDCLAFFWPRLVGQGILVCDDYGSRRCPGAKLAFDEFVAHEGISFLEFSTGQAIATKR